ncbi:MAG TPA: CbiX/SirB N-terminal domain-containing protein [Arachnia sp.]|nr:CbiX/SirB N-terminal domain-containing protein [Arachnia sp.]
MTAPAIVLVAEGPDDVPVSEALRAIAAALRESRPDLRIHLARLGGVSPRLEDVITDLVADDVAEAVLVPLDLVSAAAHPAELDTFSHSSDIHLAVSRPVGPAGEVLNILDERVREALHRGGALEIDGLILTAPGGGDVRGSSLLARRARQWSAHHRLPVQLAVEDGDGSATAAAVQSLRMQGRRHIAVGSLHLTPTPAYRAHAQAALRAGAVAVTAPIGDNPHLCQLILARYAFGAMELLDGTPTRLPDGLDGEDS